MAQLDEIVGKSNIQGVLDLDKALIALDETFMKVLKSSKETSTILNTSTQSFNQLKTVQEQTTAQTLKLGEAEKQAEKIAKEQAAAVASLERQRQKAYEAAAKQEQKEKDLAAAINIEVKSIADAEKQNKALLEAKKKLNLTTEEGKKKNEEYNKTLNKNTEFIRKNSDAATQQRMNIGNYKSALEGLPGPIGKVTTAAGNFGKQLWLLVSNPIVATVAALVAGLKLLYDSFKSTDEGADVLEQTTSSLSAAWKVITDRIGNVISGNIKLKDTFSGIREEITMTAAAASNYAATMDTISERQSLFISEEAQLKKEQAELTRVYKDATKTNEERRAALERTIAIEEQLAQTTKKNAAEIYRAELVRIAQSQTASDLTIDQIQAFIEMSTDAAEELKNNDPVYKAFWNTNVENVGTLEKAYATLVNAESDYLEGTAKAFGKKTAFDKEIAENATKEAATAAQKQLEIETAAADRKMTIAKMTAIDTEQVITDAHKAGIEMREIEDINSAEREKQRIDEIREKRIESAQEYVGAAAQYGQQLFEINQALIDSETQKMEQAKAYELQLAGDNAEKRAEIEKKYEKESAKLKAKQAKQDKAQALFSAIIKTAQAVLSGLAYGPPLGYVFAALNAALGAIQIGVIASQPIPQFYKGTKSAPDGLISVGEKGQEMIQTRSGKVLMATRPTLLSGMKGARIYSNPETEKILAARNAGYDSPELRRTLKENNDKLIRTIQNKREIIITPAKGSRITERQGNYYKNYITRKLG